MINATPEQLLNAATDAFDKIDAAANLKEWQKKRWQRAIARAWQELQSNPYLNWHDGALLILSPSLEIYEANGTCQCRAYEQGFPCWHRAAARIVQRVFETPETSH